MDFEKTFPLRLWINLGRRQDRRDAMEGRLEEAGITAERFPGIDASAYPERWERYPDDDYEGYESKGRYALALTKRLAVREAKRRGAPSILLLEDDAVFHPNFLRLLEAVELPDDWGIFYFGCAHSRKPEWAGSRVVKVDFAVDNHAVAIRAEHYDRVLEVLDRRGKANPGVARASDQFLGSLAKEIPCYAAYPNLAWQAVSDSDLMGKEYSHYTRDGKQKNWQDRVEHLLPALVDDGPNRPVKPALLFLTRGDVNQPEIWREFLGEERDRVGIFSHSKTDLPPGAFLHGTAVPNRHETRWGDISLVRATRELLLTALEDEGHTHFILLSESCVPVMPLARILQRLELDGRPQFVAKSREETTKGNLWRMERAPAIPKDCWRHQSQWWTLDRAAATFAAGTDFTEDFSRAHFPDESYFYTVMAMQGYPVDGEVNPCASTWTWWERDAGSPTSWPVLPREQLRRILNSNAMFARKFPVGADVGKYGLHRAVG